MTASVEERRFATGTVEYRAAPDASGPGTAVGYAAVFGKRSHDLGGFTEIVKPSAFTKTIAETDVLALWNHEDRSLLGRMSSGSLRLTVDEVGLRYELDLPDTTLGRDTAVLLARGDIKGSSFGFRTVADKWEQRDDGVVTRSLLEVRLRDISPVTRPAYPDSTAAMRSLAAQTHHPLDEVRAAFEARSLGALLTPSDGAEPQPDEKPVVIDEPISWLYA